MENFTCNNSAGGKPCLAPVAVWQMLTDPLLEQHYGLHSTTHTVQ